MKANFPFHFGLFSLNLLVSSENRLRGWLAISDVLELTLHFPVDLMPGKIANLLFSSLNSLGLLFFSFFLCGFISSISRELYNKIEAEGRVLLTRDRKIVQRRIFPANCIYCVKSLSKADQLKEVSRSLLVLLFLIYFFTQNCTLRSLVSLN